MTKGATLFLAFIVLCTFPIWVGLIAGGFGLIIGIFGAIFGVIAGIFGTIFGIIGGILEAIFGGIFGWGHDWNFFHFPHFHIDGLGLVVIIVIVALILNRRKSIRNSEDEKSTK
ncbi:MAG: hypothetical protein RIA63_06875 [Cyclobacteriaceae bacterium]